MYGSEKVKDCGILTFIIKNLSHLIFEMCLLAHLHSTQLKYPTCHPEI